MLYDNDIIEHDGSRFRVTFPYDDIDDAPWERDDGHGDISDWKRHAFGQGTKPPKAAGELILCWDHGSYRTYDFAGKVFGVLVQYPDTTGSIHDFAAFFAKAHAAVHGLEIPTKDSVVECKIRFDGATMIDVVRHTAEEVFIPFTVGGGVRSVDDARRLLRAGADKVGFTVTGRDGNGRPQYIDGVRGVVEREFYKMDQELTKEVPAPVPQPAQDAIAHGHHAGELPEALPAPEADLSQVMKGAPAAEPVALAEPAQPVPPPEAPAPAPTEPSPEKP